MPVNDFHGALVSLGPRQGCLPPRVAGAKACHARLLEINFQELRLKIKYVNTVAPHRTFKGGQNENSMARIVYGAGRCLL